MLVLLHTLVPDAKHLVSTWAMGRRGGVAACSGVQGAALPLRCIPCLAASYAPFHERALLPKHVQGKLLNFEKAIGTPTQFELLLGATCSNARRLELFLLSKLRPAIKLLAGSLDVWTCIPPSARGEWVGSCVRMLQSFRASVHDVLPIAVSCLCVHVRT